MDWINILILAVLLWGLVDFMSLLNIRSRWSKNQEENFLHGRNSFLSDETKNYIWKRSYGGTAPWKVILVIFFGFCIALIFK